MSSKQKKYENQPDNMEDSDENDSGDDDSDEDGSNPDIYKGNEEVQLDFEGRNPIDSDADGIKQLLLQLFLKAHINLTEMTDTIISQNYIGSVIKQCMDDDMDEDSEDDSMDDSNLVFGITTALNLTTRKESECIQQLRTIILERAQKSAKDATLKLIRNILGNDGSPTGFVINERFINIPAQISVPMLSNLVGEIKRANDKKMPYNFSYYLMILKFHRKEAKKGKPSEDLYANPEEELFASEALDSFDYSVADEADTGFSGNWLEDDEVLTPYRKFIIIDGKKLPHIVDSITSYINNTNV